MNEPVTYIGMWWLPSEPEIGRYGTLTFSPTEGAKLNVVGLFGAVDAIMSAEVARFPIIMGIATSGEMITLYRCAVIGNQIGSGVPAQTLRASFVFTGVHFESPENVRFGAVQVQYSHLNEWMNQSGLTTRFDSQRNARVIEFVPPPPATGVINDHWKVTFDIDATGSVSGAPRMKADVEQISLVRFDAAAEVPIDDFLEQMQRMERLLSLGVTVPVFPLELFALTEQSTVVVGGNTRRRPIRVLYQSGLRPTTSESITPGQMLFTFGDIAGDLDAALGNWYSKSDTLAPTYNLYFGTLYNDRLYLENRFLSLAQALESYHRRTMNHLELTEEKHAERIEAVLDAIPAAYRKWTQQKLAYSNEVSLRASLKDIRRSLNYAIGNIFTDRLVGKVVDTRNYLTHYDPHLRDRAVLDVQGLYLLCERMRLVLETCLLRELRLAPDNVQQLIQRNQRYQQLLHTPGVGQIL